MEMTRKQFLLAVAGAVGAGFVMACGGDEESDEPCTNGVAVTFTDQHGHTINILKSDIDAGVNKTYTTAGTADHTHSVTLTGAQLASLLTGVQVMVTSGSGGDGHTHVIRANCV
jgi:hypothetical protein